MHFLFKYFTMKRCSMMITIETEKKYWKNKLKTEKDVTFFKLVFSWIRPIHKTRDQ